MYFPFIHLKNVPGHSISVAQRIFDRSKIKLCHLTLTTILDSRLDILSWLMPVLPHKAWRAVAMRWYTEEKNHLTSFLVDKFCRSPKWRILFWDLCFFVGDWIQIQWFSFYLAQARFVISPHARRKRRFAVQCSPTYSGERVGCSPFNFYEVPYDFLVSDAPSPLTHDARFAG